VVRAPAVIPFLVSLVLGTGALMGQPPDEVSFPAADGGEVFAHLYRAGSHGVVLAHGGVFNKESWADLAGRLQEAGLTVLAIDFRGYGKSGPPERSGFENDLLGALAFLQESGVERTSLVGGSMGGAAAMRAAVAADPEAIDRLILLAPPPTGVAAELRAARILFVVTEGDRFRQSVEGDFEAAVGDKRLEILPGEAHAQHVFKTEQGERLARLILEFLVEE
jgi:pimeloyl-ACP methyl ester carboxylesterase